MAGTTLLMMFIASALALNEIGSDLSIGVRITVRANKLSSKKQHIEKDTRDWMLPETLCACQRLLLGMGFQDIHAGMDTECFGKLRGYLTEKR